MLRHPRDRARRFAHGAEVHEDGTDFRVFAPKRARVEVVFERGGDDRCHGPSELSREPSGFFRGFAEGVGAGTRYRVRLDGATCVADPASRFQPCGPEGPSEIVDPRAFVWSDHAWAGPRAKGQIVYEVHVGTFTKEGTYTAAMRELSALRDLGITLVELMPLADFPGRFGWGYDGVHLYAPTRLYGRPDDLRAFVDAAHGLGIGVLLDVVYSHLGPRGNVLQELSDDYFTSRHETAWGKAVDVESCPEARELFAANGAYWIEEFHLDGLRLDATHAIVDGSPVHIVREIVARARAAAKGRATLYFAETETRSASLARAVDQGGLGVDSLWNDDFHHAARVAATGRHESYYAPYQGTAQELLSAITRGFLFQGQSAGAERRGEPATDLPAHAFTNYLENHDQVSTSARGARLHQLARPSVYRALVALLLLAPGTPLLFQGQEFGASSPFVYFADFESELGRQVATGRRAFLAQLPSLAAPEAQANIADPGALESFLRCKLDHEERSRNRHIVDLYTDLLRLRRSDPVFAAQDASRMVGATLDHRALALRSGFGAGDERLVVTSLDDPLDLSARAEPLLAPPSEASWELLLSTEDVRYGGEGTPAQVDGIVVPGSATLVFTSQLGCHPLSRSGSRARSGKRTTCCR